MTDKELKAFNAGKAYGAALVHALVSKGLNFDANQWITVHPNGKQHKGQPALIDQESKTVIAGMGGKFNGKHISEAKSANKTSQQGKANTANTQTKKANQAGPKVIKPEPVNPVSQNTADTPRILRERKNNPKILSDFNKAKGLEQQWKVMDNASDADLKKLEKEWQSKYPGPVVNLPGIMLADREKTRAEWNKPRGHEATLNQYRENHNQEVRKLLENDPRIKANEQAFKEAMTDLIQKGDFAIRVYSDALPSILDDHFKNHYEIPEKMNSPDYSAYNASRFAVSRDLYGKSKQDVKTSPQQQEKYGFLDVHEDKLDPRYYGDLKIVLKKDRLMDSTTYTLGDSLQNNPSKTGCGSVKNPNIYEGVQDKKHGGYDAEDFVEKYKSGKLSEGLDGADYIELQYHGDLRPSDIQSIEMSEDTKARMSPFDLYRLKSLGIDLKLSPKKR